MLGVPQQTNMFQWKEMKELVLVAISITFAYCTALDDGETRHRMQVLQRQVVG